MYRSLFVTVRECCWFSPLGDYVLLDVCVLSSLEGFTVGGRFLTWAGSADRGLRFSSRTYVSSRSLRGNPSGLEEKSVLVQEVRPRSGEAPCNVTLGPVTRWWPASRSCWRVLRAPASYSADRARARPTATATEKTATANKAQIPQSTSRGPMTAADMEVASYAPEIARSAQ